MQKRNSVKSTHPECFAPLARPLSARAEERRKRCEERERKDERDEEARFLVRLEREEECRNEKGGEVDCELPTSV